MKTQQALVASAEERGPGGVEGLTLTTPTWETSIGHRLEGVATGKELATLKGHEGQVSSVAFAPDGRTLATGSGDRTVNLWEVATRKELATLKGQKRPWWIALFLAFSALA